MFLILVAVLAGAWWLFSMGKKGPLNIAVYAKMAGFTGPDLLAAVAIALAESAGDPQAYNPETGAGAPQGKGSYGLWQIYLNAHPEFEGQNLYDPLTNAKAAYRVFRGANYSFRPRATHLSSVYIAHLRKAQTDLESSA